MAQFYGCNLAQKPQLNRTVLRWLSGLDDSFSVFVEAEGSDFSLDFLVLKPNGIFDVEAKNWNVREALSDADWILADGETRPNPFLNQVLDQCTKVHDYLLVQREEVFGDHKARMFHTHRLGIKIFPIVAISHPQFTGNVQLHNWRKIFSNPAKLLGHIRRFEWFYEQATPFAISLEDVLRFAELLHLERINPVTLAPVDAKHFLAVELTTVQSQEQVASGPVDDSTANPYQYTYTVTGESFYGREMELRRIRRALDGGQPIAIMGLQRAGKSSLARESIRRYTEGSPQYVVIEYDFRRLKDEALLEEEDLTMQFIRALPEAREAGGDQISPPVTLPKGLSLTDQRQMFGKLLRSYRSRNKRTILFLDECQEIEDFLSEEKYKSFFVHLDALCRERDLALSVVLACRPAFFEFGVIRNCNLGRLFETIWLGALEDGPAMGIINRADPWLGIEDDAAARIRFLTGNHAFWIQFLCHRLFEYCVLSAVPTVTREAVDRIFQQILMDVGCKPQFYLLYQEIEEHPVAFGLLKTLAEHAEGEGSSVDISSVEPDFRARKEVALALRILQENQIVLLNNDYAHPKATFRVEALRCWLRCHLLTL